MKNNKQTEQWEESPVREKIRSKKKKRKYKERFGELQNLITISSTGNVGARGVQNTGTF